MKRGVRYTQTDLLESAKGRESDGPEFEECGAATLAASEYSTPLPPTHGAPHCATSSSDSDDVWSMSCSWSLPGAERSATIDPSVHTARRMAAPQYSPLLVKDILIDSRASIHLFQTAAVRKTATVLNTGPDLGHINGVGGRSPVTAMLGAQLTLEGGVRISVKAPFACPSDGEGATAQDILSTAKLAGILL